MQDETKKEELSAANFDILSLLSITKKNNWKSLRDSSIGRIIYIASVLYKFIFHDKQNIFTVNYIFGFDEAGPYSDLIRKSLLYLESNEFITREGLTLSLNESKANDEAITDIEKQREKWLETIMRLLSAYGEGKIYDFIIRDPLYQESFKRNTPKNIQIDYDNVTIKRLNSFKEAFENTLGQKSKNITPQKYLELYFEFVFSKILKGGNRCMNFSSEDFKKQIERLKERPFKSINYPPGFYKLFEIVETYRIKTRPSASFCLIFSNEDIIDMDIELFDEKLNGSLFNIFHTCNHLILDKNIQILNKERKIFENSAKARQEYLGLSNNNKTIFYISNEGTHTFINGDDVGNNTFFSDKELKRSYIKLKDISDLEEVLSEYKVALKNSSRYVKFFVPIDLLKKMYGKKDYKKNKNLLRSKPEKIFQLDLKDYLQQSIRRTFNFNIEVMLDSKERLDINTEDDEGNYYFLEIKWIGKSIHPNYNKEGTCCTEKEIKEDGIKQTLQYIQKLQQENKIIKLGWLVVFDARQEKTLLDFNNYDHIDEELKNNLYLFDVIADFTVDNINPQ